MARSRSAVLIATAAALAVAAAPAAADSILYRCFPNLCRVAPDGSGRTQLTRDAADGGPVYAWLSATTDGSRLGVSYGNRAYVLDGRGRRVAGPFEHSGGAVLVTQIRPDGGQVATIESITETLAPYPGGPPTPHQVPYLFLAGADGSGRETVSRSTAATNWLAGRLLRDDNADEAPFEQRICLLASNTDFPCERLVAAEPGHELWDPAVSPDGSLVAVTRAPLDGFSGDIAIYSAATAQLARVVKLRAERLRADVVARRPLDRLRARGRRAVGRVRHRRARLRAAHTGLRDPAGVGARRRAAAADGPEAPPLSSARADPGGRRAARGARPPRAPRRSALAHARDAPGGWVGDFVCAAARARARRAASAGPGWWSDERVEDPDREGALGELRLGRRWVRGAPGRRVSSRSAVGPSRRPSWSDRPRTHLLTSRR